MVKICIGCAVEKPIEGFYAHPQMADGRLNKCKECVKSGVRKNYIKNRKHYVNYDKARFNRPERKDAVKEYIAKARLLYPEKYAARTALGNALRDRRITKLPCEICGSTQRVQAHHEDYSKPLDVVWLCFKHHREIGHGQIVTGQ